MVRRSPTEVGKDSCTTRPEAHCQKEIRVAEELHWKPEKQFFSQRPCVSVKRPAQHHQLQETTPPSPVPTLTSCNQLHLLPLPQPTDQWMWILGSTVSQDIKWASNIHTVIKKAQQRIYFLHQLRKYNLSQELLIQLYTAISLFCWFVHQTGQE